MASITNFYTFYLVRRFGLTIQSAQLCQFVFFGAVATGTVIGGPVGDRIGRKKVIWASILGVLPVTVALPYASFDVTIALSVIIGVVISSAFPAIVVYVQELIPGRTGMVSGLFFGLIFGVAALGQRPLALSPTSLVSISSTGSALFCLCSDFSRSFCLTSRARPASASLKSSPNPLSTEYRN